MSRSSASLAGPDSGRRRGEHLALSAVALATFFVSLSTNTLSVAVPVIVRQLGASPVYAALIVLVPTATESVA
jgi:hypothetical protein